MAKTKPSLKRKLTHAAGWNVVRRLSRTVPPFGTFLAIGFVGYDIKKKGLIKGVINAGLDAIPLIGAGKNIIEVFTGDLLPDKETEKPVRELPRAKKAAKKEKL